MERQRQLGWVLVLAGLPFAPFLNRTLDLWHMQAMWMQVGLGLLVAATFWSGVTVRRSRPLAVWMGWTVLWMSWVWLENVGKAKTYPMGLLSPLVHLLLLWLAWIAMSAWTPALVEKLLSTIAWAGVIMVGYGVLQFLNLDQFFTNQETATGRDVVVGTIGNPSHFGAYLACLFAVYLAKRWWWAVAGTLLLLLHILSLGSLGGPAAAMGVWWWWSWRTHRTWCYWSLLPLVLLGGLIVLSHPTYLSDSGRLKAWGTYWSLFLAKPITGYGPGFIQQFSQQTPGSSHLFQWRHVHNEYFQLAIEQGLIGLSCVGWFLWETLRRLHRVEWTPALMACSGILFALGLNSLINFPCHLWAIGSLGLVALGGIYTLTEASWR